MVVTEEDNWDVALDWDKGNFNSKGFVEGVEGVERVNKGVVLTETLSSVSERLGEGRGAKLVIFLVTGMTSMFLGSSLKDTESVSFSFVNDCCSCCWIVDTFHFLVDW